MPQRHLKDNHNQLVADDHCVIPGERALAINPRSVGAMVGLARVDAGVGLGCFADDRRAHLAAAEATLVKALSLAPNYAGAHLVLGAVQIHTNRAAQGMAESKRALALDHNLASAHAQIGLAKSGRR